MGARCPDGGLVNLVACSLRGGIADVTRLLDTGHEASVDKSLMLTLPIPELGVIVEEVAELAEFCLECVRPDLTELCPSRLFKMLSIICCFSRFRRCFSYGGHKWQK